MPNPTAKTGILVVSHGSPRAEANQAFARMVERVASRLGGAEIVPAYFSIARPNIPDQVGLLASKGVTRVVLMPYFLGAGQHVTHDIPELLEDCRQQFPQVSFQMLPTFESEPAMDELVVERLSLLAGSDRPAFVQGSDIERRSYEIIDHQLDDWQGDADSRAIVQRVIHATADVSFARTLRIHPQAVARGRAALADGKPVLCDVRMLQAGVTRAPGEALCLIDDPQVIAAARQQGSTRAAAAMQHFGQRIEGAVVAIGNAPTALWKILEMAQSGGPRPALVVGLPVGFVGARESKLSLMESDLCYITNTTSRGGSPAAAAAVNALAMLNRPEE